VLPTRISAELTALSLGERDLAAALEAAAEEEPAVERRVALFIEALAASRRADRLASLGRPAAGAGAVVAADSTERADGPAVLLDRLADRRVVLDHASGPLRSVIAADAPDLRPWLDDRDGLLSRLWPDATAAALRAARWRWRKARLLAVSDAIGDVVTGVILGTVYLFGGLVFARAARRSLGREARPTGAHDRLPPPRRTATP